jgi:hypothetical protein
MAKLSNEMISAAILGFEQQRAELGTRIAELKKMLGGGAHVPAAKAAAATTAAPAKTRKRRKLSAAGRKAISDAAKKRWAQIHANAAKAAKKG